MSLTVITGGVRHTLIANKYKQGERLFVIGTYGPADGRRVFMDKKLGNPFLDSLADSKDVSYQEMEKELKKVPLFAKGQKIGSSLMVYRLLREESYHNVGFYYPEVKFYKDWLNKDNLIKPEYYPNMVYLVSIRGQFHKLCGFDLYLLSQGLTSIDLVLQFPYYAE